MIERSRTGVYRLPLGGNWSIGIGRQWRSPLFALSRYGDGCCAVCGKCGRSNGWSVRLLWFHFGRKDRKTWGHWQKEGS